MGRRSTGCSLPRRRAIRIAGTTYPTRDTPTIAPRASTRSIIDACPVVGVPGKSQSIGQRRLPVTGTVRPGGQSLLDSRSAPVQDGVSTWGFVTGTNAGCRDQWGRVTVIPCCRAIPALILPSRVLISPHLRWIVPNQSCFQSTCRGLPGPSPLSTSTDSGCPSVPESSALTKDYPPMNEASLAPLCG